MCKRWRDSFEDFFSDMGECPDGMSIERINNDLGYTKDNCKWATQREQVRNRSTSIKVTFNGRLMALIDVSEETGIPYKSLYSALRRREDIDAFVARPRIHRKRTIIRIDGVSKSVTEWAEHFGVPQSLAFTRIKRGWDIVRAVSKKSRRYGE